MARETNRDKKRMISNEHMTCCNICKKKFHLSKSNFHKLESDVKRKGKVEQCEIRYFECPYCNQKYLIAVKTDKIKKMAKHLESILRDFPRKNYKAFQSTLKIAKRSLSTEQAALRHAYMKQHTDEGFM